MGAIIPTRAQLDARVTADYRRYAGIGPYYLPLFGRVYSKRLLECLGAVRRHAGQPREILDVGCGLGLATAAMASMFPRAEIYGLDIYPEAVLDSAKHLMPSSPRINFTSGSIEDAPFESGRFDLITAFDVLEHVPRPDLALQEIERLVTSTGTVVASVPIESPILRAARFVYLMGGRRGEIHPHWEGSFRSLGDFEGAWDGRFTDAQRFNAPFPFAPRVMNYDVVFVGRKVSRG